MQDHRTDETYSRSSYLFDLPRRLIAQHPSERRDQARLLVVSGGAVPEDLQFSDLGRLLRDGDLLVVNQTKVMNARCFALRPGGGKVEIFFLGVPSPGDRWRALARPGKRLRAGMVLLFPGSGVEVRVETKDKNGVVELGDMSFSEFERVMAADGELPLPPYIQRPQGPSASDQERYQTIFARALGAVAAPTAGLHFTPEVLASLRERGVELHAITHHVGIGTFKPLTADDVRDHQMEREDYEIDEHVALALTRAKRDGRRIIAVGTTSTRCLESNWSDSRFHPGRRDTGLYIFPGYRFRAIDGLITNFHLPGSSLILLVCALMGRDRMMSIYRRAISRDYRFYSYGDAMLLLPDGPRLEEP